MGLSFKGPEQKRTASSSSAMIDVSIYFILFPRC